MLLGLLQALFFISGSRLARSMLAQLHSKHEHRDTACLRKREKSKKKLKTNGHTYTRRPHVVLHFQANAMNNGSHWRWAILAWGHLLVTHRCGCCWQQ